MKQPKNTNEVVIESIIQATIHLMQKRSIDEISVTDIVKYAGVSRNSFYRNFNDKDDILRRCITNETECWLDDSHQKYESIFESDDFFVIILEHLYDFREYIALLMRDKKMYLLEEEFDYRVRTRLERITDPWHIAFMTGGLYKLFLYWAETGYQKTPQEIAAYMNEFNISF